MLFPLGPNLVKIEGRGCLSSLIMRMDGKGMQHTLNFNHCNLNNMLKYAFNEICSDKLF